MIECLGFKGRHVFHGPIYLSAVGGARSDSDVENLGGALGRHFHGPLLVEDEFVLLVGEVAIEVLRFAADRGLGDSRLLDRGNDGVGGAGSVGIGGLGIFGRGVEPDVQDGEVRLNGHRLSGSDAERAIAGIHFHLRLRRLLSCDEVWGKENRRSEHDQAIFHDEILVFSV